MEIYYTFSIGGIVTAICLALVVGVYCIWNAATNNQTIIYEFAAAHTDDVLKVLLIIAAVIGVFITLIHLLCHLLSDPDKDGQYSMARLPLSVLIPVKLIEYMIRFASAAIPIFLSLSLCYGFLIDWAASMIRNLSSVVVVALLMSPVFIFLLIIYFVISLLPLVLLFPTSLTYELEHNAFVFIGSLLLAFAIGVILTIGYHHFILNHTTLVEYIHFLQ